MSIDERHHWIVEHIWRAIRAFWILLGMAIWLWYPGMELIVFISGVLAVVTDQLHGFICKRIQVILNWKRDFADWE